MTKSSILGFPRQSRLRDLKKATELYWAGKLSREDLVAEGKRLRLEHWKIQKDAGVDIIPSNDFAFYDQVLDHIQTFGVSTAWIHSGEISCGGKFAIDISSLRRLPSDTPSTN